MQSTQKMTWDIVSVHNYCYWTAGRSTGTSSFPCSILISVKLLFLLLCSLPPLMMSESSLISPSLSVITLIKSCQFLYSSLWRAHGWGISPLISQLNFTQVIHIFSRKIRKHRPKQSPTISLYRDDHCLHTYQNIYQHYKTNKHAFTKCQIFILLLSLLFPPNFCYCKNTVMNVFMPVFQCSSLIIFGGYISRSKVDR